MLSINKKESANMKPHISQRLRKRSLLLVLLMSTAPAFSDSLPIEMDSFMTQAPNTTAPLIDTLEIVGVGISVFVLIRINFLYYSLQALSFLVETLNLTGIGLVCHI